MLRLRLNSCRTFGASCATLAGLEKIYVWHEGRDNPHIVNERLADFSRQIFNDNLGGTRARQPL